MKKRREATQTDELIRQLDSAFDKRRAGDCVGALSIFESLERQSSHPKDIAGLRLFQVMCLTDLGRVDKAYEQIRRVDEKRLEVVDRIDYESEYANIKRAQGMTSAALERIERALKLSETVEDKSRVEDARRSLHALRAVLLAESGKCDEAVPLLEEIPAENPWWTEARICLGDCKIRKKSYREAIELRSVQARGARKQHFTWPLLQPLSFPPELSAQVTITRQSDGVTVKTAVDILRVTVCGPTSIHVVASPDGTARPRRPNSPGSSRPARRANSPSPCRRTVRVQPAASKAETLWQPSVATVDTGTIKVLISLASATSNSRTSRDTACCRNSRTRPAAT